MKPELARLLTAGPVGVRDHPEYASALRRLLAKGDVAKVLPGMYVPADRITDTTFLAAALCKYGDYTVTHDAAAALSWWPERQVLTVSAAHVNYPKAEFANFRISKRMIPNELVFVSNGIQLTDPALTTLDLAAIHGGGPIDEALRRRVVSLGSLWEALRLTPHRSGNRALARLLRDSRDNPWSELERLAHQILRRHRIAGWKSNYPIMALGRRYFADIGFPAARLIVELDGWAFHRGYDSFVGDRDRDNRLELSGWSVLRYTHTTLEDMPGQVRQRLRQLRQRVV